MRNRKLRTRRLDPLDGWISVKDLFEVFFPKKGQEFKYLGAAYYSSKHDELILVPFFKSVEKSAKPWWCPRWFLRLLHLYGNDNSIVRVRHKWAHKLHRRLTKGILIQQMKWKFNSYRIYGSFTKELFDLAEKTCRKMEGDSVY